MGRTSSVGKFPAPSAHRNVPEEADWISGLTSVTFEGTMQNASGLGGFSLSAFSQADLFFPPLHPAVTGFQFPPPILPIALWSLGTR